MQHAQRALARASALCARVRSPAAAAWLAAAAACTACSFTPRLAPVTAWGVFPCALAAWLAAHTDAAPSADAAPKRLGTLSGVFFLTFVATQAAASTVGLWGILQGPGVPPLAGHVALVPITVAVWCLLALPFALHMAFARRFPGSPVAVLAGPAAWTAVWTAIGELSPLGAFASPSASQAQWPLAQLAAIFGGDGIVFLLAWPGAALSMHAFSVLAPSAHTRRHCIAATIAVAAAFTYGVVRVASFAADADAVRLPPLHAACLLRVLDATPMLPESVLWERTAAHIAAGKDLVVWSETAVTVIGQAGERDLLNRAAQYAANGSAYLGVTYEVTPPDAGPPARASQSLNAFALLRPGRGAVNASAHGTLALRYVKRHPVPVVEAGFAAGTEPLKFEDAPWGRTGAAICFDSDFPALLRAAGSRDAALLVQASQTWGASWFRERHAHGNALHAVENGYTLLRCGSDGVSGVFDPLGRALAWEATGSEGVVEMAFPQPEALRARTLYAHAGGWLFGWACVAAAVAAAAAAALPERMLPQRWRAPPGAKTAEEAPLTLTHDAETV